MDSTAIAPESGASGDSSVVEYRETHEIPRPGGNVPSDNEAPETVEDSIRKAIEETQAKPDPEEKADKGAKPESEEDEGKPKGEEKGDKPEKKTEDQKEDKAKSDGDESEDGKDDRAKRIKEPVPKKFLPESQKNWANTPKAVRADITRLMGEMEGEVAKHKESAEKYENLREYEELLSKNKLTIKDYLDRGRAIEDNLARNPIAAIDQLLREAGPRKPNGQPLSLSELAGFINQNPNAIAQAQQNMPRQQTAPQQPSSEIAALQGQIAEMRSALQYQSMAPVIERFSSTHPDYETLAPKMTEIIASGAIKRLYGPNLGIEQTLQEAYRMVGGNMPTPPPASPAPATPSAPPAPAADPDGGKSISGSPTGGRSARASPEFNTNEDAILHSIKSLGYSL